ncbi:MAG: EAL domain-containing protein [Deltaproteobacteria bacterium]|nr:EAL domain-containing protein [Deltaproteobacteria bacterium]
MPETPIIPSYQEKIETIKDLLIHDKALGLLLIDTSRIRAIEHKHGRKVYSSVLRELSELILSMAGSVIRKDDLITINHQEGDQFLIFLSEKRQEKKFHAGTVENLCERLTDYINSTLYKILPHDFTDRHRINIGYAITIHNPLIQEERMIQKLIDDAQLMAKYRDFRSLMRTKENIQEIIIKEERYTLFQPIVDLKERRIIGYEALTRGPKNTIYENPSSLLRLAEDSDLLFNVDCLCRKTALNSAKNLPVDTHLFLNIVPFSIHDPEFRGDKLISSLKEVNVDPNKIVMEITEKQAVKDYHLLYEATQHLKDIGFAIAIDDVGTGYSNLQSLVELKPNFIKIDISIVRNVDKERAKEDLIRSFLVLAQTLNAKVIGEGIETKEELDKLTELGIDCGQGFYFAKPGPPFPKISI